MVGWMEQNGMDVACVALGVSAALRRICIVMKQSDNKMVYIESLVLVNNHAHNWREIYLHAFFFFFGWWRFSRDFAKLKSSSKKNWIQIQNVQQSNSKKIFAGITIILQNTKTRSVICSNVITSPFFRSWTIEPFRLYEEYILFVVPFKLSVGLCCAMSDRFYFFPISFWNCGFPLFIRPLLLCW